MTAKIAHVVDIEVLMPVSGSIWMRGYYYGWNTELLEGELSHLVVPSQPVRIGDAFVRPGELVLLDPRAVVICDGIRQNDPRRDAEPGAIDWVRSWLAEHPEWPPE